MSGILSVRDRIAMMNSSKPTPKPVPEPTASFENPVRKAGSIADKIAALKESNEKHEKEKSQIQNPIVQSQPANPPVSNDTNVDEDRSSLESSQAQSQPAERRLSIKDRIAAMKSGGSVSIVAPAISRPVSRPVSVSMTGTTTEQSTSTPTKVMVSKEDIPKLSSPEVNPLNSSANQATTTSNEEVVIVSSPKEDQKIDPALPVTIEKVSIPAQSQLCSSEATSIAINDTEIENTPNSLKPVVTETTKDNSSEPAGPKVSSIAARTAALKQQQQHQQRKPDEPAGPPVAEMKERRRLSTDLMGLGAKINIGGLMPGAPRPIFPSRPPPPVVEASEGFSNGSTSKNIAVDESGELKHLNLSRPSVNSVSRKRAVKSVKLSSTWKDELTSDDVEAVLKSSTSAATTCEDATLTSFSSATI